MKAMITIGILAGGTLGGWLGAMPDHGNWLGGWSLLGSTVGSFAGLWAGYKIAKYYI